MAIEKQINYTMKKNISPNPLILIGFVLFFATGVYAREVISINKSWNFMPTIETPGGLGWGTAREAGKIVNLPHTWNSEDFMSDSGYRRGYGSYRKDLEIPVAYKGKRLFLKFEGAGSVANVFINSNHLGEHKGAYNAFTYEITDYAKYGERNIVNVICDNSLRFDVAPQGGDFNMYGGLYRDAWLIVTDEDVCISPLYYGSSGVFVSQLLVNEKRAELRAEIQLSTKSNYQDYEVVFSVLDRENKIVSTQTKANINNDKVCLLYTSPSPRDS